MLHIFYEELKKQEYTDCPIWNMNFLYMTINWLCQSSKTADEWGGGEDWGFSQGKCFSSKNKWFGGRFLPGIQKCNITRINIRDDPLKITKNLGNFPVTFQTIGCLNCLLVLVSQILFVKCGIIKKVFRYTLEGKPLAPIQCLIIFIRIPACGPASEINRTKAETTSSARISPGGPNTEARTVGWLGLENKKRGGTSSTGSRSLVQNTKGGVPILAGGLFRTQLQSGDRISVSL